MDTPTERRYRDLAGTRRTGHFARVKARERIDRVVRKHWWRIAIMLGVHLGATTVVAVLVDSELLRGLVIGAGVTTGLWAATSMVLSVAGVGPLLSGRDAEAWTAEELQPLLDHGWRLINHVAPDARGGDHDHVLVGPGGVLVLETKWSAQTWTLKHRELAHARDQASKGATRFSKLRARKHGITARAVVVIWGPADEQLLLPQGHRLDDVTVVHGKVLRDWALRRDRASLSADGVNDIAAEVAALAAYTDDRDASAPRTMEEWLTDAGKIALTGFGTLFCIAAAAAIHPISGLGVALAVAALAAVVLRQASWRAYARAALWAATAFLALVAVSSILVILSD